MPAAIVATIVDRLTSASIAVALLAAAAWILCRLRPSLAASTRTTIWWLVAVAALLRLAPIPSLTLEVPDALRLGALLPAAPAAPSPAAATTGAGIAAPTAGVLSRVPAHAAGRVPARLAERLTDPFVPLAARPASALASADHDSSFDWRTALVALWAIIVCALFVRLAIAHWRLRRLADDADPVPDAIAADIERLAAAVGLRRTPAVRVSGQVEAPLVFGLLRPTVLLPDATLTLTPRERAMTLCHELAHVQRLDLAFAWAPAVMERLLFFHPGARLAAREYAFAREAACDADVLQHLDEAPRDYGRLLIRLGVTRRSAALAAAQSSPSTRMLRRRLALLNDHEPSRPARGSWLAAALLLPLALPLSLVAAQVDPPPTPPAPPAPPSVAIGADLALPPAPPAPARLAAPPAPARVAEPPAVVDVDAQSPPPPPPAAPPPPAPTDRGTAPPPPPPPPPPPGHTTAPPPPPPPPPPPAGSAFYWVDDNSGTFVLFDGGGTSVFSGNSKDAAEARRLRGADGGPFVYYRANGQAYTSRDPALIERIKAEMRAQHELGQRQAALGHMQAELGAQQAALGARDAHLASRQTAAASAMSEAGRDARLHALESALAALDAERGEKSAELDAARRAMREAIKALQQTTGTTAEEAQRHAVAVRAEAETMAAQMRNVAAEQRALGQRQAALGREQAELGRQQKAAADTSRRHIMRLLEEAAAAGQAQPVK